jgi:hypothetical protein
LAMPVWRRAGAWRGDVHFGGAFLRVWADAARCVRVRRYGNDLTAANLLSILVS